MKKSVDKRKKRVYNCRNKTKQDNTITAAPERKRGRKRESKMLFEEFREGTGCKDNRHNREIYRKVESLYYTAEGMTKAEAYEIARPWLNNEPSEEERRVWAEVKSEAAALDWDVMHYTAEAERYTEWSKDTTAHDESIGYTAKYYRDEAKRYREIARTAKARAAALRRWFPEAFKA